MVDIITSLYPVLGIFNLPKTQSVAWLFLLTTFISLILCILLFKRQKYKPIDPKPSESDFDEALKAHLGGVEAQNARLMTERHEIMRCIGVLLSEKVPPTHAAATQLLKEYHEIFSLMVDALKEGSASFQSTVGHQGENTILHYLYELTMRGVRSTVITNLELRHYTLLDKYRGYMDEHAQLHRDTISVLLMDPNLPTIMPMASVQNSGVSHQN